MPIPPIAGALAKLAGKEAATRLVASLRGDDARKLEETLREIYEDIALETSVAVERLFEQQASDAERLACLEENVARLVADGTAARLTLSVSWEAVRSPHLDRIKLLAGAFAGYIDPDVEQDHRNRAFRIALSLEPSDVQFLRGYTAAVVEFRPGEGGPVYMDRSREFLIRHDFSVSVLMTAGCLAYPTDAHVGNLEVRAAAFPAHAFSSVVPNVTRIGWNVIKLLTSYAP